ncbi:glutamine ABC transporter ATP-binding protein GlnQ [Candidatus Phycorickettsia trachydisci]|uniref:Glutamine ABC transporter ATP-binding protein GlnQ n=1 Tax=Candidatus Phycorickettsia trachydisci TaxID=2115978 RepID=A0A2P1P7I4_9RICK|nr:amino acid ABC transporter ATP-binding protein [Candidatus Phycorickettsia trachydisci]AVP87226.1 glutamine ABC transporter ATP-binding protein GlnQ [Candidatus Phycorickettsia trachydisci]
MIRIENLSKKFGDQVALKDISLTFEEGKTTVILGPSGSGKSTLLRCIKKLEQIDSGKMYLHGKEITKEKQLSKIGLVFQNFNLFPHFTVLENLTYAPRLLNPKAKLITKAKDLLLNLGLSNKINAKPKELSGGQKQRVAIARALMLDPEILLFDEPTSALDRESTALLIKIICELKSSITMLIVSHEISFARAVADRIIFMEQGMALCHQDIQGFFEDPDSHRARLFLE